MSLSFSQFAVRCSAQLEADGRFATARLYRNALKSFTNYIRRSEVQFTDLTRKRLVAYERDLRYHNYCPNTISTYMRMLRAIYNKGVDAGYARFVFRLFHDVYTGIDISRRRALDAKDLKTLLCANIEQPALKRTQKIAASLYSLCGMSFVDFMNINFSSVNSGVLTYNRHKTGTSISISVMKKTMKIVNDLNMPRSDMRTAEGYRRYQSRLRYFNSCISRLAAALGITRRVSSYTLRHSWATAALRNHVPVELISAALGHRSIRTTQIYLGGFSAAEIGAVNSKICRYLVAV
ncbi:MULTISPECIES: tyrosine-type recombinase/integrase [Prevotella]|uniref:Integrase n=1 Tax=Prevotella herbatica TaxID=2801997 RepID=A0ABN6EFQ9_9BACT|nr:MULTISPECIES: site-specific integrase [Prevotella]MDN5553311.1 site-specific integrase [Prevotella sp.]BCS84652.1 integrase [Prevotella herbatica]